MAKLGGLETFAYLLVLFGALNWGLVGIFDYNVVHALFGEGSTLTKISYVIIGISAVYFLFTTTKLGGKKA